MVRHCRNAALLAFAVSNGYHLLNCAARLVGLRALQETMQFDPEVLAAYLDSDITHGR